MSKRNLPMPRQWAAWQWEVISAEHDRRKKVRKENRPALRAARRANQAARAAEMRAKSDYDKAASPATAERAVWKSASKEARSAQRELAKVRKTVPASTWTLTAAAAASPALPGVLLGEPLVHALVYPSVAALVVSSSYAWWRWRHYEPPILPTIADGIVATAAELALMERLQPEHWAARCEARGLKDTITGRPELGGAGIRCAVRLDNQWTPDKFRSAEGQIRALLGLKTGVRMEIRPGKTGEWAQLTIRTRSASDGLSLAWKPGAVGIGVDEITGDVVDVPMAGTHKLIAGVTNMGKSVAWRPWMMQAISDPVWAGILLDPKRLEARLWQGRIRTEGHQEGDNTEVRQAIYDAVRELVAEMQHRQRIAKVTQWVPTADYPNLLVVIEEGRQLIQMSKDKRWADVLDLIDDLYTLARATGIWIIWATQYPSRTNGGVTAMVSENSLCVMSLTVDSPVSDRVVYGENAADTGWEPSKLGGQPGRALVKHKDRKPHPVRIWHVTDDVVRALPQTNVWRHTGVALPDQRPALSLVKPAESAPVSAPQTDRKEAVRAAMAAGHTTTDQIAKETGISRSAVGRLVKALREAGEASA